MENRENDILMVCNKLLQTVKDIADKRYPQDQFSALAFQHDVFANGFAQTFDHILCRIKKDKTAKFIKQNIEPFKISVDKRTDFTLTINVTKHVGKTTSEDFGSFLKDILNQIYQGLEENNFKNANDMLNTITSIFASLVATTMNNFDEEVRQDYLDQTIMTCLKNLDDSLYENQLKCRVKGIPQ